MLYDGNNPILKIIAVAGMKWKGGEVTVNPRAYSALAFRISGSAEVEVEGEKYYVNQNEVLYMPQNYGYKAVYTDTEMIVIHFITQKQDLAPQIYEFENGEQLYKMFLKAKLLWQNKEPGYNIYTLAQVYNILGTILESETKANLPKGFLEAVAFINSNFKNNQLSVADICKEAKICGTALRQNFKNHYGKSPVQYITELRLDYARNLIAGGETVEAAAINSGFNDSKYFSRLVKKHFACTPRDLKNYGIA